MLDESLKSEARSSTSKILARCLISENKNKGPVKTVKQLNDMTLLNKPSQSYEASLDMWDHRVTCHPTQVNALRLTPATQAGTLTYSRRGGRLS